MSQANSNGGKKFTAQELKPKWSVKINHTPNKGREYFTVSYYDENRKRQRRLYSDLVTAQKQAEKLRERMDRGLMPGLLLNGVERLVYERGRSKQPGPQDWTWTSSLKRLRRLAVYSEPRRSWTLPVTMLNTRERF